MPLRLSTLAAALLALSSASASASAAHFSVAVNAASGTLNTPGPTVAYNDSGSLPLSLSAASTMTESTPPGWSNGSSQGSSASYAAASAGGLHLLAASNVSMVSANGGGAVAQGGSSATASLSDSFIINAVSCSDLSVCGAGAVGAVTFSIAISGTVGGSGSYTTTTPEGGNGGWSGNAEWSNGGSVNAGSVPASTHPSSVEWQRGQSVSADQRGPIYDNVLGGGVGSQSYTISFVFGQAISFSMLGQAYSGAGTSYDFYASQPGGSSASTGWAADLSHTMAWGGIQDLRDAEGHVLTDYAALSADTGFDYRNAYAPSPVPEPASAALMAAGIAGLAGLAIGTRRRRLMPQA